MKVTLVEPSFSGTYGYEVVFPFGYASLGVFLQRDGHQVEYILPAANRFSIEDVVQYIASNEADLIGIGGSFPYLPAVIEFVKNIKNMLSWKDSPNWSRGEGSI